MKYVDVQQIGSFLMLQLDAITKINVIQKIEKDTEQYPCTKNKSEPTIVFTTRRNTTQN